MRMENSPIHSGDVPESRHISVNETISVTDVCDGRMKKRHRFLLPVAAFFLPALTVLFVLLLVGDNAIGDPLYVTCLNGIKRFFHGQSFFPLTSLYGDASPLIARYGGSVLTYFAALLPSSWLDSAAVFLLPLRAGLCGLASYTFFAVAHEKLSRLLSLSLSFYCAFSFVLLSTAEGAATVPEHLLFLPLSLVSTVIYIRYGRRLPLLFSLCGAFLTGFPVAYAGIALYVVLCPLMILGDSMLSSSVKKMGIKHFVMVMLTVTGAAFLIASPLVLLSPGDLPSPFTGGVNGVLIYRIPLFLASLLPGAKIAGFSALYVGMASLLLFPLYMIAGSHRLRYRLSVLALFLLGAVFFLFFNPFSGALGGIFAFTVLSFVADIFRNPKPWFRIPLACLTALFLLVTLLLQKFAPLTAYDGASTPVLDELPGVYVPLIILIASAGLIPVLLEYLASTNERRSRRFAALFLTVAVLDMSGAAYFRLGGTGELRQAITADDTYDASVTYATLLHRTNITPVSRIAFQGDPDDNASVYLTGGAPVSCLTADTVCLLNTFGADPDMAYTADLPPVVNALLGIRYAVSNNIPVTMSGNAVSTRDGYTLYESANCLPLVYAAQNVTSDAAQIDKTSPFTAANSLLSALTGTDAALYTALITETVPTGLIRVTQSSDTSGLYDVYKQPDRETPSAAQNTVLTVTAGAPADGIVYFRLPPCPSGVTSGAFILKSGVFTALSSSDEFKHPFMIGSISAGRTVRVLLYPDEALAIPVGQPYLFLSCDDVLHRVTDTLSASVTDSKISGDLLTATVTVGDGQMLMTGFPADGGYRVTLDGVTASTGSLLGLLTAEATPGVHTVTVTRNAVLPFDGLTWIPVLAGIILFLFPLVAHCKRSRKGV